MEEIDKDVFILDGGGGNATIKNNSNIGDDWINFYFVSDGQKILLRYETPTATNVLDMDGYRGHSVSMEDGIVGISIRIQDKHNVNIHIALADYFNGGYLKEYAIEYLYKKVIHIMKEFTDTIYGFDV